MIPKILFRNNDTSFVLKEKKEIKNWIISVVKSEKCFLGEIHYIFCNDDFLLEMNKKYLNHNTFTDIITFDYSENISKSKTIVSGEIFISIECVKRNAIKFKTSFENELQRVIIHGILHLIGYKDKTKTDAAMMRKKEAFYLELMK